MTSGYLSSQTRDGTALVACWCESKFKWLPLEKIWVGTTFSCGKPGCSRIAVERNNGK